MTIFHFADLQQPVQNLVLNFQSVQLQPATVQLQYSTVQYSTATVQLQLATELHLPNTRRWVAKSVVWGENNKRITPFICHTSTDILVL